MKRLLALAKFSSHHHMERLIVECARNNDMQVSDHIDTYRVSKKTLVSEWFLGCKTYLNYGSSGQEIAYFCPMSWQGICNGF